MTQARATPSHGITTIDTGFQRPRFDAAYLIVENGRGAFVDCGTNHSVPAMLQALAANGLDVADVDWLVLTHVHLDHAGGAGALMRELPNARLLVHPRGAPHMIDPSRLIAGATAVYGEEEMTRSYGTILPVPEARVVEAPDGCMVELAGRPLHCIDTPGHARHHLCLWDARSRCWFTGDTFGLSYREFDTAAGAFALPTTTPVQFEPEALKTSVRRLLEAAPEAMYVTHFGRVEGVERLAAMLLEQIDAMTAAALRAATAEDVHASLVAELKALYRERLRAHGVGLDAAAIEAVLAMDIELNAQGLEVWLARR
ncbi:MBL fold metallo-hydrolase [Marilutibacter chinensis]|uniref:MBL fold metallo-hydrolase n=1 Tax=Marilutibacter chinensis TaxID=2912247 RepID=A0ABS9HR25_9GAMM|nr:MBL fold metallo-hydrolase [Lysobacter chinensis]MCF7221384.1 MBL fold metallo-hydrolase [Lysobacter chinensis]